MLDQGPCQEDRSEQCDCFYSRGERNRQRTCLPATFTIKAGRKDKPFIALNCAALPETLLESELFGYEKGAFTGAIRNREGKFELAHTGTLLLDEVTEIPLHLQAKLLRVLQESEVDRLGGKYPVPIDVRVIATTNIRIEDQVKEARFRKDLYYRLNVIPLRVPPLRERPGDIVPLAEFFLARYSAENGSKVRSFAPEALKMLADYSWPGNVRELQNVVQRAVLISDSPVVGPGLRYSGPRVRTERPHRLPGVFPHAALRSGEDNDREGPFHCRRQSDPCRRNTWHQRQDPAKQARRISSKYSESKLAYSTSKI